MARAPMTLMETQKAEVETLAAVLTAEQVADYFGIGRRTFYSMMQRDDDIAARYKRGKAKAIGAIAQGLITKARAGDTTSMIFFLKTQGGWRETSTIEHMLPEDPEPGQGASFRQLTDLLDGIAARNAVAAQQVPILARTEPHEDWEQAADSGPTVRP